MKQSQGMEALQMHSAGGWQRGCVFGTGGSNDSASMVHIRKGET